MIAPATITAAVPLVNARGRKGVACALLVDGRRLAWSAASAGRCDALYVAAGLPRSMPPSALVGKRVSVALARFKDAACVIAILPFFAETTDGTSSSAPQEEER